MAIFDGTQRMAQLSPRTVVMDSALLTGGMMTPTIDPSDLSRLTRHDIQHGKGEPRTPRPTPRLPSGLPPHPRQPRIDPGPPQPLKFAAPPE